MNTKVFLLALLAIPVILIGQELPANTPEIKVTPPSFTGIEQTYDILNDVDNGSLETYIIENIRYTDNALVDWMEGTEVVQFTITPRGILTGIRVINSVCHGIDKEVIRILKNTDGMWKPGYNDGVPVSMEKEVTLVFFIDKESVKNAPVEYFTENAKKYFDKANDLFLISKNPKKALKYYDNSIRYLPNQAASLLTRGLCRYELGDRKGACSDWNRVNALGLFNADEFITNLCELKGYEEMVDILNK